MMSDSAIGSSSSGILIGWSTISITPDRPVVLCGQFHPRISQRVNDPVMATALSIESEGEQAVMISCDLVFIDRGIQDRVRKKVAGELSDLDVNKLFINATHTHTGPNIMEQWYPPQGKEVMTATEYVDFLVEQLSRLVVSAWRNRKPGGISWALSHAVVGRNRRAVYFNGSAQMYGSTNREDFSHIEGYEDHSLNLIFTWDQSKSLTGIVVNIGCPSQVTEGESYISADFWHEVRLELKKRYSEELFILPQCSAAGDQSPHLLFDGRIESEMRSRKGVSERQEIALRIANGVDYVFELARKDIREQAPFIHRLCYIDLPVRKVTEKELQVAKSEYERLLSLGQFDNRSPNHMLLNRAKSVIERYYNQETNPYYHMEYHVIRLGDIAIATNPFEMFLDYGIRIKARSKALQTFIVQLACDGVGYFGAGYLPTERAVAGGGYGAEVASNLVGPEGGQLLVQETINSINSMWQ